MPSTRLSVCLCGLRMILRASWTAKKSNELVGSYKAGVKRELLDTKDIYFVQIRAAIIEILTFNN